jgi:regulator of sigma E protease
MQIFAGLLLLAILIVFHELGHFLFAKMLGVKVLVFSLGFGPRICGFKYGDTDYRLCAIPLGGYVRMFGESLEEELNAQEKAMSFIHQPIWRKSLIAFAGPLFNFILPIILFFGLAVGTEQVFAPVIGTVLKDSVAARAGLLPDDRIIAVDKKHVETFADLAQIISEHPDKKLTLDISRASAPDKNLQIQLMPEAKANPNPLDKNKFVGRVGIMPAIEKAIIVIDPQSSLHQAGLSNFDTIKAINNINISSMSALENNLPNLQSDTKITLENNESIILSNNNLRAHKIPETKIINNLSNKNLSVQEQALVNLTNKITREDRLAQLNNWGISRALGVITSITPASLASSLGLMQGDRLVAVNGEKISSSYHLQYSLTPDNNIKILGVIRPSGDPEVYIFNLVPDDKSVKLDADLASIFGVSLADVFKPGEAFERHVGMSEALKRACTQTYAIAAMTVQSLWMLVTGTVSASQVGGPIMIFDVAQQAAHKGLSYYIFIMCLMSVNLGLLNLLPIPALDGGHLLLFGIEAVQRKPLTPKTRAIATQIGFAILLLLMGLAIFNDLYRLFK